jgi:hypothetical protein
MRPWAASEDSDVFLTGISTVIGERTSVSDVVHLCKVKSALLQKYHDAVLTHSAKVVELQKSIYSKDEFDSLYRNSKEAQKRVAEAREELGRHIAEHGC